MVTNRTVDHIGILWRCHDVTQRCEATFGSVVIQVGSFCLYGCFSRPQYLAVGPRKIGGTADLVIGRGLTPGSETK